MTWYYEFSWKEWKVTVEADVEPLVALERLNRGLDAGAHPLGAADRLWAFPAFHLDPRSGKPTAEAQPRGDPFALARDLRALAALSADNPSWRFHLSSMGAALWTMTAGAVGKPWRARVQRFLAAEAEARAVPPALRGEVEIAIHAPPPTRAMFASQRERLRRDLGAIAQIQLEDAKGRPAALVGGLAVGVEAERARVAGTPMAGEAPLRYFLRKVAEALFGGLAAFELEIEVRIDGEVRGRAANAIELHMQAPVLARWARRG